VYKSAEVLCCLPAAATLLDIVTEAKRYQGKALIAHINRAINLLIRRRQARGLARLKSSGLPIVIARIIQSPSSSPYTRPAFHPSE
jgi:hypothetical protein